MNEPRVIVRICADCGMPFEIKLAGKAHWWQGRKIITPCFHAEGTFNLREMARGWSSKFLFGVQSTSRLHQFLSEHIWWWSIPEAECSVPNWKKPYLLLKGWVEDFLDPPERIEYWECPTCLTREGESSK